jgi:hypothetical protein
MRGGICKPTCILALGVAQFCVFLGLDLSRADEPGVGLGERCGRLRASPCSFSGNPEGCDHSIRQVQAAIDLVQAKASGARPASAPPPGTAEPGAPLPSPTTSASQPPCGRIIPLSPWIETVTVDSWTPFWHSTAGVQTRFVFCERLPAPKWFLPLRGQVAARARNG